MCSTYGSGKNRVQAGDRGRQKKYVGITSSEKKRVSWLILLNYNITGMVLLWLFELRVLEHWARGFESCLWRLSVLCWHWDIPVHCPRTSIKYIKFAIAEFILKWKIR